MPQVFISYSRVDDKFTNQLVERLQQAFPGLTIWRDKGHHGLIGGDNWWDAILKAIEDSQIFLYVLSNESIQSIYCQAEFEEARRLRKRIITIQARDRTELTDDLDDIQFIDMKDGVDNPDSLMRLNAAIHKQLGLAKKERALWTPKTAKPGKEKQPVRDANSPDIATPPLTRPTAEQDALKVAKAGLRWQIVLGIAALIVTLIVGLFPFVAQQNQIANETAVALAKTQTVLDLTPALNPVQKVETLDAQATQQEALLAKTRENMTAQARLNAIESSTAQGTVDAEASANARMDGYATLTALASFTPSATKTPTPTRTLTSTLTPTLTHTPTTAPTYTDTATITPTFTRTPTATLTATATKIPTQTPTPLSTSITGNDVFVTFRDDFDGNRLSLGWYIWRLRPSVENGVLVFEGDGTWSGITHGDLRENNGILVLFKYGSAFEGGVRLHRGDFYGPSWREWTTITWDGANEWSTQIVYSTQGSKSRVISRPSLKPNVWYYLLYRIGENGRFYTQIWEKNNPSSFMTNINTTPPDDGWDTGTWEFTIQVEAETLNIDFYEELRFPENFVMPDIPPNP